MWKRVVEVFIKPKRLLGTAVEEEVMVDVIDRASENVTSE